MFLFQANKVFHQFLKISSTELHYFSFPTATIRPIPDVTSFASRISNIKIVLQISRSQDYFKFLIANSNLA